MKSKISRREMLKLSAASIGGLALSSNAFGDVTVKENKRPTNVLFINTDQQRFDALSCAGNSLVPTPNLDRLASEGVRFTQAFTAQPECAPARSCFHTGWTVYSSGCTVNQAIERENEDHLVFGEGSFDQVLAKRGYTTEYHGRWHAPLKLTDCYANEVTLNFMQPYRRYLAEVRGEPAKPKPGQEVSFVSGWPYDPDLTQEQLGDSPHADFNIQYGAYSLPTDHTFTGFTATKTIDALKRLKDQPFSISAAVLSPHHPWYVPRPFLNSVDPDAVELPATMHNSRRNTPWENFPWQLDEVENEHMRLFIARYYELVREVDYQVGRILDTLEHLGLADSTLVIFTADHGEMLGEHGLTQKFLPFQGSVRVPLIMRLPGVIAKSRVVDHPVNTLDIFSTIFDYLGQPCPKQQGRSLRPLVEGKPSGRSEYTFSEQGWGNGRGWTLVASNEWKYVWTHSPESVDLLYDLQRDPHEQCNLLGANPDRNRNLPKARQIRQEMLNWMEDIGHPLRDQLATSSIG